MPDIIDCAHYTESFEEDKLGYFVPKCACGWQSPPAPDEETATDFLMQHAYEAGYAQALQNAVAMQQGKLA